MAKRHTVLLLLLLAAPSALSYASGAPVAACQHMTPRHTYLNSTELVSPQSSTPPYEVNVNTMEYTDDGVVVELIGPYFVGFLIQARGASHGGTHVVGSFELISEDTQHLDCDSNAKATVTHTQEFRDLQDHSQQDVHVNDTSHAEEEHSSHDGSEEEYHHTHYNRSHEMEENHHNSSHEAEADHQDDSHKIEDNHHNSSHDMEPNAEHRDEETGHSDNEDDTADREHHLNPHTDDNYPRRSIKFLWRPTGTQETVQFRATVVQYKTIFWTNITSATVKRAGDSNSKAGIGASPMLIFTAAVMATAITAKINLAYLR